MLSETRLIGGIYGCDPDCHEHRKLRTAEKDLSTHVFPVDCQNVERNLTFRDRLQTNAADRNRYEKEKRGLARTRWPDMNAYAAAKTAMIEEIIASARIPGEKSR